MTRTPKPRSRYVPPGWTFGNIDKPEWHVPKTSQNPDRLIEKAFALALEAAGYDAKGDFKTADRLLARSNKFQMRYLKLKYGHDS